MKLNLILKTAITLLLIAILLGCSQTQTADDTQATAEGVNEVIKANNQFAFSLYKELRNDSENIFFSPYSISAALAMTYEGAKGKTAEEIQKIFDFPADDISRRSSFAKIYNDLNKNENKYDLSTANALWGQRNFSFEEEYIKTVKDYYAGKLENLDFKTEAEESRKIINKWIEQQTNNKITDMIPSGAIDSLTRLVITNAIYFKGDWLIEFDKKNTRDQDFKISEGSEIKVPMMGLRGEKAEFSYAETDDVQLIELLYQGEEISMLVILPKEGTLDDFEKSLDYEKLSELKNQLEKQRVDVYLPKFKFETKSMLKQALSGMGMPTAFSEYADFSGMTNQERLKIAEVIHQAYIDVNEEGTEAAAATAVVMKTVSISPIIPVFRADSPFIFLIQQKDTGNILFMGRVLNPVS